MLRAANTTEDSALLDTKVEMRPSDLTNSVTGRDEDGEYNDGNSLINIDKSFND